MLLTTQYLDEADRLAARIAVIDHGRVIAEGTPDELKAGSGGEQLVVRVGDGSRPEAALEALAPLACGSPHVDDGAVVVPIRSRGGVIAEAVRRLDRVGVAIDDLAVRTPTLDDVFLQLTGRVAESEEEAE